MSNGEMRTSRAAQKALARRVTEQLPPSLKSIGFTVPVQAGVGKRTHDTLRAMTALSNLCSPFCAHFSTFESFFHFSRSQRDQRASAPRSSAD
jgi:hypothetical protein